MISELVILPVLLVMALISPLAGRLYDRFGIKRLFFFGGFLLFISSGAIAFVGLKTALSLLSLLNVLRCLAIGCLMMPLVNYGTHALEGNKITHATALLTSLRTIAGAVGSAVFVSVLTIFSTHSSSLGKLAQIFGMHVSFILKAGCALILLAVGIFSLHNKANS